MEVKDCSTCKYGDYAYDEWPCFECLTVMGYPEWEPDERPEEEPKTMLKGYCDVCNEWATASELLPCVENDEQSPPMTCGLLKPHKVVEVEPELCEDEGCDHFGTPHVCRPVTFEDAKRRLVEQAKAAEPPMWSDSFPRSWEELLEDGRPVEVFEEPEVPEGLVGALDTYTKITSDGGSTSYYDLPTSASELNDLVEYKNMGFARGNIFKACYRLGEKSGTDSEYDIRKIIYFAERMLQARQKGLHV